MGNTSTDVETTLEAVRRALISLRYGSIEITVHDSRVVQIERKEKIRLSSDEPRRRES